MIDAKHTTHDPQMSAVTSALEAKPRVTVPDDFTARMMVRLPKQQKRRLVVPASVTSRSNYGILAACVSLVLLLAGMTALAPRTQGSTLWLTLQAMLFVQFCGFLLWMGISRRHTS